MIPTSRWNVPLAGLLAVLGCGSPAPRFGEVTVSAASPVATLSGRTRATAPAFELSAGCPGYLDPDTPEHLLHLTDSTAVLLTARSMQGPLAIAVVSGNEVRCDSDSGAGHAPHVLLHEPGDYAVHVASLNEATELPYELTVAPAATEGKPQATSDDRVPVSVTITSDPPGAVVTTPEGREVGTTPTMFALTIPRSEIGQERRFVLELPGRQRTEVGGHLTGGAMVLHVVLGPEQGVGEAIGSSSPLGATANGPELVLTARSAQPIRDYQVARQSLAVEQDCTIERASVDVDIRHSFIADLRVVLRSPRGTEVTLHDHGGGGRANLVTSFDWSSRRGALRALAGQNARGRWQMSVYDDAGADTGVFRSFTLHLHCREGVVASATSGPPDREIASPPVGSAGNAPDAIPRADPPAEQGSTRAGSGPRRSPPRVRRQPEHRPPPPPWPPRQATPPVWPTFPPPLWRPPGPTQFPWTTRSPSATQPPSPHRPALPPPTTQPQPPHLPWTTPPSPAPPIPPTGRRNPLSHQ